MDRRRNVFVLFIFTSFIVNGHCLYGRRYKAYLNAPEKCTKHDPIPQPNTNINDISGKLWYGIRQSAPNPSDAFLRDFSNITDVAARWFSGSETFLLTQRLGRDPGYCETLSLQSKKIPGKYAYTFFASTTQTELEYRVIHFSKEYLIIWLCFEFDKRTNCINSALGLYRNRPDFNIGPPDMSRLNKVLFRATCEQIVSRDLKVVLTNRGACPDLMLPGIGPACY